MKPIRVQLPLGPGPTVPGEARTPPAPPLSAPPQGEVAPEATAALFSKASRPNYQGFFGRVVHRLGAWFGSREVKNLAGGAVLLGAARVFEPSVGAPLPKTMAVVDPPKEVLERLQRLQNLSSAEVPGFLSTLTPRAIAELDAACGDGWCTRGFSLRELIHETTDGSDTRDALRVLDAKLLQLLRGDTDPVHDERQDPANLFAKARDGRLPQTIHKLLELRRLKRLDLEDLANRHEVTNNNALRLHTSPPKAFAAMLQAIAEAEDFVHVAFFIWKGRRGEELADALIKKAQEGKTVRVIVDEAGAWLGKRPGQLEALIARMREGGVQVECNRVIDAERPIALFAYPDHRKTVLIDGRRAFVGGVNVGDEYIDAWHDLVLECEGDLVHQIHAEWFLAWLALGGFIDPWLSDEGLRARYFPEPEPVGDTRAKVAQTIPGVNPEIKAALIQLIDQATETIDVENPYITEAEIQAALERAQARGVRLRVIIPAENNHYFCDLIARPAFKRMLEAGAEIYAYPGMAHGKIMVVDGRHVSVGTANLDDLSLEHIAELNVVADDPEFAARALRDVFEVDLAKCRRLEVGDITRLQAMMGSAWRIFARVL